MKVIMTVLVALSFSFNAFADQCQVLSQDQMSKGVQALKAAKANLGTEGKTLYVAKFCQPCGDTFPTFEAVSQIGNKPWTGFGAIAGGADQNWEITINGNAVDTAYVYFLSAAPNYPQVAEGANATQQFNNLAKSTGCKAERVSDFLNVSFQAQKDTW